MKEHTESVFGCMGAILFLGFGLIQLGAGWAGIEETWGWGWGLLAIVLALLFRFTLPITIGCFLCAHNIWEWHWLLSLLFALPGLLFMVPGLFISALSRIRR